MAFGAAVAAGGDLVVNTSQTGYQEVCTDPSYAGQVVVMTYPLIGNYGRLVADDQSIRPWLRALVVANATAAVLDDARQLAALLRDNGIPAIAGVDTRALARHLRANGCLRGIVTAPGATDPAAARAAAAAVPRWEDQDFVGQVSPPSITEYEAPGDAGPRIGIVDLGLKNNIVRAMRFRGARVRVLPHTASPSEVLSSDIDGVILSPGPGRSRAARGAGGAWPARSSTTGDRCSGSASVTRSSAGPRAPTRAGFASGTTAPTTRSTTSRWAWSRSPRRTTRSRSSATRCRPSPGSASARSTSTTAPSRACATATSRSRPSSTTPRARPGPLDALAVFDRFVAAATRA